MHRLGPARIQISDHVENKGRTIIFKLAGSTWTLSGCFLDVAEVTVDSLDLSVSAPLEMMSPKRLCLEFDIKGKLMEVSDAN